MKVLKTTDVLAAIHAQQKVGATFSAKDLKGMPKEKLHSVQSALWTLFKKGHLDKPRGRGTKGIYILRARKKNIPTPTINPAQAIYDLLDFMAKAEAPLKRAARILEFVETA
jgi:hypothetical protein